MATYKTVGLVLGRRNLGEADRIITFLTPDHGKVRAVARGVRRIKSRQAGHLELFSQTELMLAHGRNLDVVASARLVRHYGQLTQRYDALARAYLVAEMADRLTDEGGGASGVYVVTKATLEALDADLPPTRVELWFRLRLLAELGYRPRLDACHVCRQAGAADYQFDVEHGSIAHRQCAASGTALSMGGIKLWRLALAQPPTELAKLSGAEAEVAASLVACTGFYDYLFGRRFKAAGYLSFDAETGLSPTFGGLS